ncbi:SMP-30/gluconolactonase/LRE family protein [Anaerolineales bacterium HSG25]|nr:SMP-30/gluconolactonase/LRE family protein [Anaerolineales bacterium HSG25]
MYYQSNSRTKFYMLLMVAGLLVSLLSTLPSMNTVYAQEEPPNLVYLPLVLKNYPSTSTPVATGEATPSSSVVSPGATVVKQSGDYQFTEGPAVDSEGNVYFTDIATSIIYKWSLDGQISIFRENSGGANGLFFDSTGNLLACEGGNQRLVSIDSEGNVTVLKNEYNGESFNQPNDLWVDAKDGVYFSDPIYSSGRAQEGEHVYYLTPNRDNIMRVVDDMVRPNGIIGTADGQTLYVTDHGAGETYRYTIAENGGLTDKTLFVSVGADGMTIDANGNIYLAVSENDVLVYDSSGNKIETIAVSEPTNITFGGADNQTLFITARTSVYTISMQVKGGSSSDTTPTATPSGSATSTATTSASTATGEATSASTATSEATSASTATGEATSASTATSEATSASTATSEATSASTATSEATSTSTSTSNETATSTPTATSTSTSSETATSTPTAATTDFTLTSSAVSNGELLSAYKCEEKVDGVEKSIPLAWSNVPTSTGSLAVIMHHYPNSDDTSNVNSYLLLWGIAPSVTEIAYGGANSGSWFMGANKDGAGVSYSSPCSPSEGSHEYTITLYALSETPSSLPTQSTVAVNYDTLKTAIGTVKTIDTAVLTFNDVTTSTSTSTSTSTATPSGTATSTVTPGGTGMNINQTLSDEAQKNTIAYDALAFLTGDLCSDSFLPPGKVADFSGFQYLRDNDPTEMGHNTDFVTIIAYNILNILDESQTQQMITLAKGQINMIDEYAYGRFPLMKGFRRQLEGDVPAGSTGLDKSAVMTYSAQIYKIDGQISYDRAKALGIILRSLTTEQKAKLDALTALNGVGNWDSTLSDPLEGLNLSQGENVAVMTYASEMYSWYAGSVEADTYINPERQGTYFGSFYMKDMPAMGNPGFTIPSNLTAEKGAAFLATLNITQSQLVTSLVDIQRDALYGIVSTRASMSTQLRKFITEETVDEATVLSLAEVYGEQDGEIVYNYAINFAEVDKTLTSEQRAQLVELRVDWNDIACSGAFLYSAPLDSMPVISNTDFLFGTE